MIKYYWIILFGNLDKLLINIINQIYNQFYTHKKGVVFSEQEIGKSTINIPVSKKKIVLEKLIKKQLN